MVSWILPGWNFVMCHVWYSIRYFIIFCFTCKLSLSLHKSSFFCIHGARIARWCSTGLWAGWSVVRFPARAGNFSLHHHVQTGSGNHPVSYPMGIRGSFSRGKAAGTWSWPLTSICCQSQECVELYLHFPNTPSWCGTQLKNCTGQLYLYLYLLLTFITLLLVTNVVTSNSRFSIWLTWLMW
jgi:hypothetical protein